MTGLFDGPASAPLFFFSLLAVTPLVPFPSFFFFFFSFFYLNTTVQVLCTTTKTLFAFVITILYTHAHDPCN